ncbi:hypothetical protein N7G274_000992 [Stereocaulon virgatum]|uniref:Uncharacterized protein n=1 Tax=Stereocaulon virgatum TaxID=373712 RepID=A0ABR4AN58_9LECA
MFNRWSYADLTPAPYPASPTGQYSTVFMTSHTYTSIVHTLSRHPHSYPALLCPVMTPAHGGYGQISSSRASARKASKRLYISLSAIVRDMKHFIKRRQFGQ